jgi:DNA repair protein RecO (recombination protein O)
LLAELGYALTLTHDVETGTAIDPAGRYHYVFDSGPRLAAPNVARETDPRGARVRGATLLALATLDFPDADVAAEAKRMMREVLDRYLEQRHIFSRRVVRDLMALDEEGPSS